jgi:DNA-binding beta-propeller fold protein YncE
MTGWSHKGNTNAEGADRNARVGRWARLVAAAVGTVLAGSLTLPGTCLGDLASLELVVETTRGGARLNAPQGVALNDATGEIILANTNDHRIEIYSPAGRLITRFTHMVPGAAGSQIEGFPKALAAWGDDRILVADARASYVDVLDYRGRSVARLETPSSSGLSAVAITRGGSVLAAPGGEGRIFRFAPDRTPRESWGEAGHGPGQLSSITAITELPDGMIAVTCAQTELAVQIFDPSGRYVRGFGRHDIGAGNFSLPSGVAATRDGRIWVSDELRQVVQVFDSEGRYIGVLGRGGKSPGEFLYPSALAADGGNRLAVTETVGARFQVFRVAAPSDGSAGELP